MQNQASAESSVNEVRELVVDKQWGQLELNLLM
jgi:hypothetical protein